MIVCRKPCMIYDVDIIGVAALALLALAACFGIAVPANVNAGEQRSLSARIAAANARAGQANVRLRALSAEIDILQAGVNQRAAAAPKPGALTAFLQRVATLADDYELQITQVLPNPTEEAEGYLFTDIRFVAGGSAPGFLRLVDQLTLENPYCALRDFAIQSAKTPGSAPCQLAWTLRLFMLESEPLGHAGGEP